MTKRFLGRPNFIFDTNSPFFGKSAVDDFALILRGPDLLPGKPNYTSPTSRKVRRQARISPATT